MITHIGKCSDISCEFISSDGYCQVTGCLKHPSCDYPVTYTQPVTYLQVESKEDAPYYVVSEKELDDAIKESLEEFLNNSFLELVYNNMCNKIHSELAKRRYV